MSTLPNTFIDNVKAKINEHISGLIPEADLNTLVEEQVAHFQRTEFPKLVRELIHAHAKEMITAELKKPEYQSRWDSSSKQVPSDVVKKIVTENMDQIFQSMVGGMAQMVMQNMISNGPRLY